MKIFEEIHIKFGINLIKQNCHFVNIFNLFVYKSKNFQFL